MPIITKYVCDRCKAEQPEAEQMWNLSIALFHTGTTRYHQYTNYYHGALWCRKCVDEVGVMVPLIRAETDNLPKTTLEDIIREIIKDQLTQEQE